MELTPDTMNVDLTLAPEELAATVEALHDTLLRRLKWTVYPGHSHWKSLDWQVAHDVLDQLVQAYTKAMMTFRSMEVPQGIEPTFDDVFGLPVEIWELLNQVSLADSWEKAPVHTRSEDCKVCFKIAHA